MTHTAPDFERATARELAEWPGVSWAFERLAKHRAARITFAGESRVVVYPTTASDHRALANHIADLRRQCRDLGAERRRVMAAERKRVRRPRVEPERSIKPTERLSGASPARDPWAALRESMG